MTDVLKIDPLSPEPDLIERAATILRAGGLVAFPTETVYGLGAHALDATAVRRIFAAKDRPDWDPLIVHVASLEMSQSLARSFPRPFDALTDTFWPGPLTLVVEKTARVPDEVTARKPTVALRMPHHPVAAALLRTARLPIAAPSANRFGRPSPTRAEHVIEDLGGLIDLILDAGPTPIGVESTVLDLTQSPPVILRPGGVTREQLEKVIGPVALAAGMSDEPKTRSLAGPGMTIKHYAPRAQVELFESGPALHSRAAELHRQNKRIGVIEGVDDADHLAQTLFAQLRALDAQGADVILCVLPLTEGIGLALRDRLLRAAGKGGQS